MKGARCRALWSSGLERATGWAPVSSFPTWGDHRPGPFSLTLRDGHQLHRADEGKGAITAQ